MLTLLKGITHKSVLSAHPAYRPAAVSFKDGCLSTFSTFVQLLYTVWTFPIVYQLIVLAAPLAASTARTPEGVYLAPHRGRCPSITNFPVESEVQRPWLYHHISSVNNKKKSIYLTCLSWLKCTCRGVCIFVFFVCIGVGCISASASSSFFSSQWYVTCRVWMVGSAAPGTSANALPTSLESSVRCLFRTGTSRRQLATTELMSIPHKHCLWPTATARTPVSGKHGCDASSTIK